MLKKKKDSAASLEERREGSNRSRQMTGTKGCEQLNKGDGASEGMGGGQEGEKGEQRGGGGTDQP